jgi:hypothetical protein
MDCAEDGPGPSVPQRKRLRVHEQRQHEELATSNARINPRAAQQTAGLNALLGTSSGTIVPLAKAIFAAPGDRMTAFSRVAGMRWNQRGRPRRAADTALGAETTLKRTLECSKELARRRIARPCATNLAHNSDEQGRRDMITAQITNDALERTIPAVQGQQMPDQGSSQEPPHVVDAFFEGDDHEIRLMLS